METWEFTSDQVRRVRNKGGADDVLICSLRPFDAVPFDSKGLCKQLLEGKAIEIQDDSGEGPLTGFIGSPYGHGTRAIQLELKGEMILNLLETNGATLDLYRESNAKAFGALYEQLASQARAQFEIPKADSKGD